MSNFFEKLTNIYLTIMGIVAVVSLIVIVIGNGNAPERQPSKTYKAQPKEYELLRPQTDYSNVPNVNRSNYHNLPEDYSPRTVTPDDAYDEGYDKGYAQGYEDGSNGESHGYLYSDKTDYYNYFETKYQEGYKRGYNSGYTDGLGEYEDITRRERL